VGAQSGLRSKDEVDVALKVVEDLFRAGSLEEAVYYKLIVSLAYEYFCCDEQQEALVHISRVPAAYFELHQLDQMRQDGMYAELVVLLSYKMIQAGVMEGSDDLIQPTMPVANA